MTMRRRDFPHHSVTHSGGPGMREWHKQFNAKTNVWEVIVRCSGIEQSRAYFHTEQAANSWIDRCQSRADGSYNRAE
jgi:hypothetical protein